MRYYPVFLNLRGKTCLVVGAGRVGRRKAGGLVRAGAARVLVVDVNHPGEEFAELLDDPVVDFQRREFRDQDLDGVFLAFAATSSEEANLRIGALCAERGIPCNIADRPDNCSFIVPAVFTRGDLTLAVSTSGASPALARKIRQDLEDYFGREYGRFLDLMGRLRPMVLDLGLPTEENTEMFRAIVASDIVDALGRDDADRVRDILEHHLPDALRPRLPELVHGLV